jgi:predicted HAD superfamily phosphohydrolase YqeG
VRPGYWRLTRGADLLSRLRQLRARTIILDVEPLVAYWDTSQEELDRGVALMLEQVATLPGLLAVCFATNSARLPSAIPAIPGVAVQYLVSARKPLRTGPYLQLPRPGALIGDQVVTDGLLARRLGYTFVHYRPPPRGVPLGPRLLDGCGQLLRPMLFTRRD